LLPLDRDLLLLLHRFVDVDSLSDLNCGNLDVGYHCVKIDILGIIVKLARRLLIIEHKF
jgi:hypothetical protein